MKAPAQRTAQRPSRFANVQERASTPLDTSTTAAGCNSPEWLTLEARSSTYDECGVLLADDQKQSELAMGVIRRFPGPSSPQCGPAPVSV